ncbi:hypothetical protein HYQ44_005090 [Verticillium longisporum]|nr:hypothetical protein HYQ44_005090 [Verticillium longisporum]
MAKDLEKAIREQETLKAQNGGQDDDSDDDDDDEDGDEDEEGEGFGNEETEGTATDAAGKTLEQDRTPETEEVDPQRLSKLAIADDHRVLLAGLLHLHTSFHHTAAATTSTSSSDPPGRVTSPSGHRSTTSHIATAEGLKALMSVDLRTSLNCLRHPSRIYPTQVS